MTTPLQRRKQTFKLKPYHAKDSYKIGHPEQYPDHTEYVYTNMTARSDRLFNVPSTVPWDHKVTWVGIQATIMEYVSLWDEEFFKKPLEDTLVNWSRRVPAFTGNSNPDTERLAKLHKLGYLPLHIKSLPEGSRVNIGVPLFTIVNTHPDFGWLTNSTETYLSNESWKLPTVATIATAYRKLLDHYAALTGTPADFVDWQGHCFADRGMSGMMDAAKACAGHSVAFLGSDSVSSVDWIEHCYFAENSFVSGSVPATEHAVMCLGEQTGETETIRRLITKIYPKGVVSIVSDTWDFWKVISETAKELKAEIEAREDNELGLAKVVFRPDSGDPVKVLTGWKVHAITYTPMGSTDQAWMAEQAKSSNCDAFSFEGKTYCAETFRELSEPEVKGAVEVLWDIFGGTVTDKGFKLLNRHVGLIYGDSITLERADQIMKRLMDKGFASGNVVLGIGSYTYQYITRDTFGMALKATRGVVEGVPREIFKDPVTDIGKTKKSAKGLLRVEKEGDDFVLYDQQTPEQEAKGVLQTVFHNNDMPNLVDWKTVRQNLGLITLNV